MTVIPTAKLISAMATIQSNLSSPSAIELADRVQKRIFVLSIVFGVIAALIAALLAWLVWRSNNRYQEVVKTDADARIASADSRAAEANAKAAQANDGLGKSNVEIARLTKEAEQAKTERAEADKQIAIAQADAARANEGAETAKADAARAREGIASAEARSLEASAEVGRLQVVVANAETKRAEAEKALLELQLRVNNRVITPEQQEKFLAAVNRFKQRGKVIITSPAGNIEAINFGSQFTNLLKKAGWEVEFGQPLMSGGKVYFGVVLFLPPTGRLTPEHPLYHAEVLVEGLKTAGITFGVETVKDQIPDQVRLFVGPNFKP